MTVLPGHIFSKKLNQKVIHGACMNAPTVPIRSIPRGPCRRFSGCLTATAVVVDDDDDDDDNSSELSSDDTVVGE